MDLETRIRRRRRTAREPGLVLDFDAVSPVAHLEEPVDRGPLVERLLDHVEPAFDGTLPGDAYVHGPPGAGKSAVVAALFDALAADVSGSRAIGTTTRTRGQPPVSFVYVDARHARTDFARYRAVLDGLVDEGVPEQGVGTDDLRDRLADRLSGDHGVVVAVDHLGEPETPSPSAPGELLDFEGLSVLAVGRDDPGPDGAATTIEVPAYREHGLVDVLTERATSGLARHGVDHDGLREIAAWADGDAHDALAALCGAVHAALTAGRDHVTPGDVADGMADVPQDGVELGRVLAMPATQRTVLRELLGLDEPARSSVGGAADAIAGSVDLSGATVERLLYELADVGVVERVTERGSSTGRPPSRVVPRFPTLAFRRLYDMRT
jgi:Cdc6-like AAA superfamily ATPase